MHSEKKYVLQWFLSWRWSDADFTREFSDAGKAEILAVMRERAKDIEVSFRVVARTEDVIETAVK